MRQASEAKAPASDRLAANRTCILVIGMHRSGTSALARTLNLLGAELPTNLLGSHESNPTGHWEPQKLVSLHDRFLNLGGSRWDDWRPFKTSRIDKEAYEEFRRDARAILEDEFGDAPFFVLKEPRISRFVTAYLDILASMNVDVTCVLTMRNPVAVAASMKARDNCAKGFSTLVWLRHSLSAELDTRGVPRILLFYESLVADWRGTLSKVTDALPHCQWRSMKDVAPKVLSFLSPDLQHHKANERDLDLDPEVPPLVKRAYKAFLSLDKNPEDPEAAAELDSIRGQFDAADDPIGDALFTELAGRRSELQGTRASFERKISEQKTELASLDKKSSSLESELSEAGTAAKRAEKERAGLKGKIGELEKLLTRTEKENRQTVERLTGDLADRERETAEIRREMELLADKLAGAMSAIGEMHRDNEDLYRGNEEQHRVNEDLRRSNDELSRDIVLLRKSVGEAEADREKIEADLASNRKQLEQARLAETRLAVKLQQVYASTSWRLTSPLRQLKTCVAALSKLGRRW